MPAQKEAPVPPTTALATLIPSEEGLTTRKLILDMIEAARVLSREPDTYWTDQLNNRDSIAGYYPLGEEIWTQTKGKLDAFVHCVGTAASSREVATVLKRHKSDVRIVVVEPLESSVLLGGSAGPVLAAIQVAERLGPGATVVALMADSGLKYLSSDVYRRDSPPR